jgi:hypothetical protein
MKQPLKNQLPVHFLVFLAMVSPVICFSQFKIVKRDISDNSKAGWLVGLTYLSNNVYLGRKDSVALPYLTPSLEYHGKSGLYAKGSFSYVTAPGESRIDVVSFEGGWAHNTDKFNAEFSATKDFYSQESYSVKSEISGGLSGYLSYDFGPLEPSLDLGAEIGSTLDFGVGLGLEHSFTVIEDHLEASPSVKMNASTQNFYSNYYNKRRYSPNRKNNNGSITSAVVYDASKFQIMDYELGASIEYTVKKRFKLNFSPVYAIPVNPATIETKSKTSGNGQVTNSAQESLSNVFYFSLGMTYKF